VRRSFDELMDHARDGHTEIVLEAVDRDRGLLARADQNGGRLLDQAACCGRADLVGALLDRGADIHARDNDG
jgi:ankyrin repeat protein